MAEIYPIPEKKRFDLIKEPIPVRWWLRPIVWLISFPIFWLHRSKIVTTDMDGVKPPYILLCSHNAFYDFMVATVATFPHQAYYIVAVDGFIGREWLMRGVGCIGKRKFTNDISIIRHMKKVLDRGKIAAFYPEARYSLCGTNAVLPESLGKMIKLFKVPVATLITHGHHIDAPFWKGVNPKSRMLKTTSEKKLILTREQIEQMSVQEINKAINEAFVYDDFKWQKENKVRVKSRKRAEGLEHVLYKCPHCGTEYRMSTKGTVLTCGKCCHEWEMDEYGQLSAIEGETYFSHIPNWYEWQRECVRKEVEDGTYMLDVPCKIKSLPNSRGFINVGEGHLTHTKDGFLLKSKWEGNDWELKIATSALYSVHIEYNYKVEHRDCIDLSTLKDTFFVYPKGSEFSVTKISLATEELFKQYWATEHQGE